MHIIKILLPKAGLFPLDYLTKKDYSIGDLVLVPFRNKECTGIVWEIGCADSEKKLKEILDSQIFPAQISQATVNLIKKASEYYLAELGTVAKLVLPVDINETPLKINEQSINLELIDLPDLSQSQQEILKNIKNTSKPALVKGVTGSGKTEIYFHAIEEQLKLGKQALVMLPEIALSSQIITRFTERFGFAPAIWNSTVTKAQKKRTLRGIISGKISVVIGARSSLFLPYINLGIIVIDEEHDASYKQNEGMLYHARDMAVLKGALEKCITILASATPSIESIHNAQTGKYQLLKLQDRFNKAHLPDVRIVDMRNEELERNHWLSPTITNAINNTLDNNQQTLIFLNRRGYAPLMMCKDCGYRIECKSCSSSMVMHKSTYRLECHHCGATAPVCKSCPECSNQDSMILCGPGIERIAEEAYKLFPGKKIVVVSKEQSSKPDEMQKLLEEMASGEIDILIGTQIVTKGYHFPNLTLVVVVDADVGFVGGDLRASERTFQLLHQVGGRAGRADKKGTMMLQTYSPENKVIEALASGQEDDFISEEIKSRQAANMPPFAKMAAITITGKNDIKTMQMAKDFVAMAPKSSARILGPAEAMMLKLSGRYRYKILVIAQKDFNLRRYLELWKRHAKIPSSYQLKIDIDPHNLL